MKLLKKLGRGYISRIDKFLPGGIIEVSENWKTPEQKLNDYYLQQQGQQYADFQQSLDEYAKRQNEYINAYKNWEYVPIEGDYPVLTNVDIGGGETAPIYTIPGSVMSKAFPNYTWGSNQTWEPNSNYYIIKNANGQYAYIPNNSYISQQIDVWKDRVNKWNSAHSTPYYEQRFNYSAPLNIELQNNDQVQQVQHEWPQQAQFRQDNRSDWERQQAQNMFDLNTWYNEYQKQKQLEQAVLQKTTAPFMLSNHIGAAAETIKEKGVGSIIDPGDTVLPTYLKHLFDEDNPGILFTEDGQRFRKNEPLKATLLNLAVDILGPKVIKAKAPFKATTTEALKAENMAKSLEQIRQENQLLIDQHNLKNALDELAYGKKIEDLMPRQKKVVSKYGVTTEALPEEFAEVFQKQVLDRLPQGKELFEYKTSRPSRLQESFTKFNRKRYSDFIDNLNNGKYVAIDQKTMDLVMGSKNIKGYFCPGNNSVVIVRGEEVIETSMHEFRHMLDDLKLNIPEKQKAIIDAAYDEDFVNLPNTVEESDALFGYQGMESEKVTTNLDARMTLLRILYKRGVIKGKNIRSLNDVYKLPVKEQNRIIAAAKDSDIIQAVEESNGYGRRYVNHIRNNTKKVMKEESSKQATSKTTRRRSKKESGIDAMNDNSLIPKKKVQSWRKAMIKVAGVSGVTYGIGATQQ